MTELKKLSWVGGIIPAVIVARYLGVPWNTLLIVGAVLLCPAAMYFGMRGMGQHQHDNRLKRPTSLESNEPTEENKGTLGTKEKR